MVPSSYFAWLLHHLSLQAIFISILVGGLRFGLVDLVGLSEMLRTLLDHLPTQHNGNMTPNPEIAIN